MKKLAWQILILTGAILVVCTIWRFALRNSYTIEIPIYMDPEKNERFGDGDPVDFTAVPEEEDVVEFEEGKFRKGSGEDNGTPQLWYLEIDLKPKGPGTAFYEVKNPEADLDHLLYVKVGRLGTIYDMSTGGFTGDIIVMTGITAFLLGLCVLTLLSHIKARGPELYSYQTIYTAGLFLFSAVTGLVMLYVLVRHVMDPYSFKMMNVYSAVQNAPSYFMTLTFPLLLVFSLGMLVSNIELLRHERPRVQNLLGILAAFLLLAGEVIGFLLTGRDFAGSEQEYRILETTNNVYCTVFSFFECMLAGAVICGLRAARHRPALDRDYIIILGCSFRKDGTLTPLLRGRCDRAIAHYREQKEKTGKAPVLIPSGGQGKDECMPEAEAMARYLLTQGIPESGILREDRSKNTFQNMAFSKKIIEERAGDAKTAFSTTNYHVFRSGVWASLAGLPAEGMGSRTKWWFWPNAFLRECVGLFVNRVRQMLLVLVIIILFFSVLSMTLII